MAASRVINQQSFHDGKLVLYQLENRPKQLWLCRIKVPNGNGYVYRGTGTSDFYEARKFADDLLDEIRIKTKLGQSVTGPNLAKMAEEFETHSRAKGEPTNRDLAITAFLKTYAVPYFTKNKITDISAKEIAKFFDWRRANSRRKAPTEATMAKTDPLPSGMGQAGRAQVGADPSRPSDADELRADHGQHRRPCRGSKGASLEGH